jgi:ferredoxin
MNRPFECGNPTCDRCKAIIAEQDREIEMYRQLEQRLTDIINQNDRDRVAGTLKIGRIE